MADSIVREPPGIQLPGTRGDSLDRVRQRNLSLVLGLVHTHGARSRAWLTRETGLNRSTIAALVAELAQLGLVTETDPDQTRQVGRPSLVIRPSDTTVVVTVNPELDAVTIGVVALGGRVIRRVRHETAHVTSASEVVGIVAAALKGMRAELGSDYRIVGLGVAVPGLVRDSDGLVALAPHLGWRNESIARMIEEATGLAVVAVNDATAGAIAETTFGAGRGIRDVIYLNGGASGIGGGVVSAGELMRGASGYAGELGHLLVNSGGVECHCGARGCLETEVSRKPLLDALGLEPGDGERLEGHLLAAFAPGNVPSPRLADLLERQLGFLALALGNTANLFNPRLIVLGGFLGSLYSVAPERLEAAVRQHTMPGPREDVRLARAALGSSILMIGAAELAFAELLANPAL
ncbi:MAG: ROK family transcriptional regulator [Lacisediminihabitans sp.]